MKCNLLFALAIFGIVACDTSQSSSKTSGAATEDSSGSGITTTDGGQAQGNGSSSFDHATLLQSIANNVMVPRVQRFLDKATALETTIAADCAAWQTNPETASFTTSQTSWKEAMEQWQFLEVLQLGPALDNDAELKNVIYSWPLVSACAVDQDVMLRRSDAGYQITQRLINRRGLDALEYVLFTDSLDHQCPLQVAPAGWDALSDTEKQQARCDYAHLVSQDLLNQAQSLDAAWDPAQQNYAQTFVDQAGSEESRQATLNQLIEAFFYLDTHVKDIKLGQTTGIMSNSCGTTEQACLDNLESSYSQFSKENVLANLLGAQALFHGNESGDTAGVGFDDWLIAEGATSLANDFSQKLQEAIDAIEAITPSFKEQLAQDLAPVNNVHAAVKAVTDLLKTDLVITLMLDVPDRAAGDSD